MSKTENHNAELDKLLGDVYSTSSITPEQLLQYADHPESLSGEEKQKIADQLDASPALADELRILQNFNPSTDNTETFADAVVKQSYTPTNTLQNIINNVFANAWLPAGAMAVVALSVTLAVINNKQEPASAPQLAEDTPLSTPREQNQAKEQLANKTDTEAPIEAAPQTIQEPIKENRPIKRKPIMLASNYPIYQSPYELDSTSVVRGNTTIKIAAPAIANTLSAYPKLYWLLEKPINKGTLRFELLDESSGEIVYTSILQKPAKTGLQKIAFHELDIKLQENTRYEWSVLLEVDPNNPALDQFASVQIKYVPTSTPLIYNIDTPEKINLYAQNGYWYEAFHESVKLKEQHPENQYARKYYDTLVETLKK